MTINSINLLYTFDGDNMKVYLDVIILVNTLYDFLILSSVSILLKKHITNNNIEAKIRQQLQILRNKGIIEFLGRGHYRKKI